MREERNSTEGEDNGNELRQELLRDMRKRVWDFLRSHPEVVMEMYAAASAMVAKEHERLRVVLGRDPSEEEIRKGLGGK